VSAGALTVSQPAVATPAPTPTDVPAQAGGEPADSADSVEPGGTQPLTIVVVVVVVALIGAAAYGIRQRSE